MDQRLEARQVNIVMPGSEYVERANEGGIERVLV